MTRAASFFHALPKIWSVEGFLRDVLPTSPSSSFDEVTGNYVDSLLSISKEPLDKRRSKANHLLQRFNEVSTTPSFAKLHDGVGSLPDGRELVAVLSIPVFWYIDTCFSPTDYPSFSVSTGFLTSLGFLITCVFLITFWFSDYRGFLNSLGLLTTLWSQLTLGLHELRFQCSSTGPTGGQ